MSFTVRWGKMWSVTKPSRVFASRISSEHDLYRWRRRKRRSRSGYIAPIRRRDGKVYLLFSNNLFERLKDRLTMYSQWSIGPDLLEGRRGHSIAADNNKGLVLAVGGASVPPSLSVSSSSSFTGSASPSRAPSPLRRPTSSQATPGRTPLRPSPLRRSPVRWMK